jgi:hypothetical protein
MNFKTTFLGLMIAAFILTGCVSTQDKKLVEIYASELEPYLGKGAEQVVPMITDQWEFKLQARWAGANPSPEVVLKKNHHRAPFSKKEANEIFKEKGYYNVLVFAKKGSEGAAIEAHPAVGFGPGYHEHVHKYANYVFFRFVFRDKKLHDYRCFRVHVGN